MWRRSLWIRVWVPVALFLLGVISGLIVILLVSPPQPISEQTLLTIIRSWDLRVNHFVRPIRTYTVSRLDTRPSPRERALAEFIARQNYSTRRTSLGVYVEDITDATAFGFHADDIFTPASLLKVPLAMAALQISRTNNEVTTRRYSHSNLSMDENSGEYFRTTSAALVAGKQYFFDELIEAMLISSDNNARSLLADAVGGDGAIKTVFDELRIAYPAIMHGALDFISPRQYAGILRALVNGTYLSEHESDRILRLLVESDFAYGMRAGIPNGISVASKFGERTVYGVGNTLHKSELHECGIVYDIARPFILCIMTTGENLAEQADVIRDISRFVYELITT